MSQNKITIKKANDGDFDAIWKIFHSVVIKGDTYAYDPKTTKEEAYRIWMSPPKNVYAAILDDKIVGTYFLTANQPGLGNHIANAGYMVHPDYQGLAIGSSMASHSIDEAKKLNFTAMQFNFVISTNTAAVSLWKKMGFKIVGTIPKAFNHASLGFVDVYIMYKDLQV
jgi:ribosomal protein S18 acetylase RimI-like enzyme